MRISDWSSDVCSSDLAFRAAAASFRGKAETAKRRFHSLSLVQSFRSTPPVLELVDAVIAEVGSEEMGLLEPAEPHDSAILHPGEVILWNPRSEEHTSELQSLMRISYAVFCLKKKTITTINEKKIYHSTTLSH